MVSLPPSISQAVKSQISIGAKPPPPSTKTTQQQPPPTTVVTAPAMDEDTISRKTSTIIDELSENSDFKVSRGGVPGVLIRGFLISTGLELFCSGGGNILISWISPSLRKPLSV